MNLAAAAVETCRGANIVGIKDSSSDFTLTGEYIRLTRARTSTSCWAVIP